MCGEIAADVESSQDGGEQHEEAEEEEEEGCLDRLALMASSAETDQLLRLAEVEHILGAACLQLGLAAAAKVMTQRTAKSAGSSPCAPTAEAALGLALPGAGRGTEASKATVAEAAAAAAGGRVSWGFGAGPFTEVFATKSGIFSGGEASGGEDGDGDSGLDECDEGAIIAQLEVFLLVMQAAKRHYDTGCCGTWGCGWHINAGTAHRPWLWYIYYLAYWLVLVRNMSQNLSRALYCPRRLQLGGGAHLSTIAHVPVQGLGMPAMRSSKLAPSTISSFCSLQFRCRLSARPG